MKRIFLFILTFYLSAIPAIYAENGGPVEGGSLLTAEAKTINRVVIANRASGTISVINSDTDELEGTYDMPDGGQPMYVVYNSGNNTVLVGDYNGKVAAFDGSTFEHLGSATAGNGVFHMWLSPDKQQLWVNNELDKTISVINPNDLSTISTFSIPADLVADYKPHDVIIMPNNSAAFVTMLGSGNTDFVVKYSATTFEETDRIAVGPDPHVSLTGMNDKLYVASQGTGELKVLNRADLTEVATFMIPNADGLGMNNAGTYLYIGNIGEGGANASWTLDLSTNTLIEAGVDAPFPAPHNYAVTQTDDKLFVTHSGAMNDKVSIYNLGPTPTLLSSVTVGNNPFGLVAYSYEDPGSFEFCVGDGIEDHVSGITLSGNIGANGQWVIATPQGEILGLPPMPGVVNFDVAGAGVCLIRHLSYEDGLTGLEMGMNINDLAGCFSFSNVIEVVRLTGSDCNNSDGVDLELSIDVDKVLYEQYEQVTYTITASNSGSEDASGVVISAGLPGGLVYSSHNESAGNYSLFFEEWTLDLLAAGESETLELVLFTLVGNVEITNFTEVLEQDQDDTDSTPGNGNGVSPQEDDEAAITIRPTDSGPQGGTDADLSLSITADENTYDQYETVTYTITLTNNGPDDATGIDVFAGLPDGMVYSGHSSTAGDYSLFHEQWNLQFLAQGESAVLELVLFTLIEDDDITNFVEVIASDQDDPDSTPDNGNGIAPQEDDEAAVTIIFVNSFAGSIPFPGINTSVSLEGVHIYPVPTNDQLTISLSLPQSEIIAVQIFDIAGRVMSIDQVSLVKGFNKFKLDVDLLPNGMYFLSFRYSNAKVFNQKFQKVSR